MGYSGARFWWLLSGVGGDIEVHFCEYHDRSNKSNLRVQLSKLCVENVPKVEKH